eukprot:6492642-Amphidinium_carterae.1
MDAINVTLPVKAFLRRALRVITALEDTTAVAAATQQPASGPHMSAASLALQLAPSKEVNVVEKLKSVNPHFSKLDNMPFHMLPESSVWSLLQAENDAATASSRTAFSYVDLTSKEWLPLWIAPDAVGGKTILPGDSDWLLSGDQTTTTLSAFGKALQQATQAPRFFRNLTQWVATFQRYSLVAEAMSQFSRKAACCHLHTVLRLAEEERIAGGSPYLAILYDDLLRKQFARRAQQHDPQLDISSEVQQTDKAVLASARSRLEATLQAAGLKHSAGSASDSVQHTASSLVRQHDDLARRGQMMAANLRPMMPVSRPPFQQHAPQQQQQQQHQPQQAQQSSPNKRKMKADAWFTKQRMAKSARSGGR